MKRLTLLLLILTASACHANDVLRAARSFSDGGHYNNKWTGSGTPEAVIHDGQVVLPTSEGGTYCCGFTFCVAAKVARDRGLLEGLPFDAVKRFQKDWYGAAGGEDETLVVLAVERLGIGTRVELEDAEPGDFVQLWRTKSGHSVIFLEWIEEAGEWIGFRYRSSQGSTDGIGDTVEYFSDSLDSEGEPRGHVDRRRTYVARLNPAVN